MASPRKRVPMLQRQETVSATFLNDAQKKEIVELLKSLLHTNKKIIDTQLRKIDYLLVHNNLLNKEAKDVITAFQGLLGYIQFCEHFVAFAIMTRINIPAAYLTQFAEWNKSLEKTSKKISRIKKILTDDVDPYLDPTSCIDFYPADVTRKRFEQVQQSADKSLTDTTTASSKKTKERITDIENRDDEIILLNRQHKRSLIKLKILPLIASKIKAIFLDSLIMQRVDEYQSLIKDLSHPASMATFDKKESDFIFWYELLVGDKFQKLAILHDLLEEVSTHSQKLKRGETMTDLRREMAEDKELCRSLLLLECVTFSSRRCDDTLGRLYTILKAYRKISDEKELKEIKRTAEAHIDAEEEKAKALVRLEVKRERKASKALRHTTIFASSPVVTQETESTAPPIEVKEKPTAPHHRKRSSSVGGGRSPLAQMMLQRTVSTSKGPMHYRNNSKPKPPTTNPPAPSSSETAQKKGPGQGTS